MIRSAELTITFIYKGKSETRKVDRMHISYYKIKDFYRIPSNRLNYDIYKKDGIWCNMLKNGLSEDLLQLLGNAIDVAEK